jgi:hypothetical protein
MRAGRIAVVIVWVGLLLALARSQWPRAHGGAPAAPPVPHSGSNADDAWMGVYMHGQKIGYSHDRMTPIDGGYRFEESSFLRLSVLDQVQTVRAIIDATASEDFAVRAFTVTLDSGLGALDVRGAVDGNALVLRMGSGDDRTEQTLPLNGPLYFPSSARAQWHAGTLEPGRTITVEVFDPSALDPQSLEMHVIGRETVTAGGVAQSAWHVRERFRGNETSVWLDDAGHTLREEGPMDMVLEREEPERAVGAGWGDQAVDLLATVAVRVKVPIADPRHLDRFSARLSGTGDLPVPNDARQSFRDGELRIERERVPAASYALPYAGADWHAELASTPFLQSDHPRVQAAAREAVGDERDPLRAAERLRAWVFRTLEKRPVASIPNAVQVLQMRAGDCNEHAVLFAALARALGLPARVVAGVVYADGAFLYHAWNEVWLGAGWMTVDATFDQMPVDATHIKLVEGGPETHAALLTVIGKLAIDPQPLARESQS